MPTAAPTATVTLAQLNAMTVAQLTKLYNELIVGTEFQPIKKFSSKEEGTKRLVALQKSLRKPAAVAAEKPAKAPKAKAEAIPAEKPAKVAKAAKAEKPAKETKRKLADTPVSDRSQSAAEQIRTWIRDGLSNEAIFEKCREVLGFDETKKHYPQYYRRQLASHAAA